MPDASATVLVLGALDTKGAEYAFACDVLRREGCRVYLVDTGFRRQARWRADVSNEDVARAAGVTLDSLSRGGTRSNALETMTAGARQIAARLLDTRPVHAVFGLGGSNGTSLISAVMRDMPLGLPKVLVSTIASGQTRGYVGPSDLWLIPALADIAGINTVTTSVLTNAAVATAAIAKRYANRPLDATNPARRVAATMFGVTQPCVDVARGRLEAEGFEVVTYHANGVGGEAMERAIREGFYGAVLDITTTEIADEVVGGVMAAGSKRLTAAGDVGIPQVVSLGSLDVVCWGPLQAIPGKYRRRRLIQATPELTVMRTSRAEAAEIGALMAERLNGAKGPTAVFIPLHGFSPSSMAGGPFHDPAADRALINALRTRLSSAVQVVEVAQHINAPEFATAMATTLTELVQGNP